MLFDFAIGFLPQSLVFMHQNWNMTLRQDFHNPAYLYDLGNELNDRIHGRTPVDTGALMASEKFQINPDQGSDELLYLYSDSNVTLNSIWHRAYTTFQEGEPLGLPTYTNDPHEMYYLVGVEDMDIIESWGASSAGVSLKRIASNRGVQF